MNILFYALLFGAVLYGVGIIMILIFNKYFDVKKTISQRDMLMERYTRKLKGGDNYGKKAQTRQTKRKQEQGKEEAS